MSSSLPTAPLAHRHRPQPRPHHHRRLLLFLIACLLLAALPSTAAASYGHEPPELVAHHDKPHPEHAQHKDPQPPAAKDKDNSDDATLRADDASFQKLDSQREELNKKLSEIEHLRSKMLSKSERLKRVRALRLNVDKARAESNVVRRRETAAQHDLSVAVQRKNATWDEKEAIARQRRSVEDVLQELKTEGHAFDEEIARINDERARAGKRERELEAERERLLSQVRGLVHRFHQQGMHTWLERHLSALPPVVRETIVKTSTALDPVLRGVEEASELTEEMSNDTTEALRQYVPVVRDSPFYSGLVFYVILLCPTVAAAWLVLKVRARLSQLTVEHGLIAMNLYFGMMATACAVMSLIGRADVLIVFRHRARHLAESFMLVHGLLFVLHLGMHGMTAYVTGSRKDFAQYISMSCVGLHFFMNAYKRTILDQDPNVGATAYVLYAAAFLYTLYDRGVHIIEAAVRGKKASAAELSTFPAEPVAKGLPNGAGPLGGGDSTVYFAGLPVFNGPSQSSVDDAKTI